MLWFVLCTLPVSRAVIRSVSLDLYLAFSLPGRELSRVPVTSLIHRLCHAFREHPSRPFTVEYLCVRLLGCITSVSLSDRTDTASHSFSLLPRNPTVSISSLAAL